MGEKDIDIRVRVVPRSSRSEIVAFVEGILKIRIAAPPVDGAANAELVKVIAKAFGVSKSSVVILSGESSKTKRIRITGASKTAISSILRP